MSDIGADALLDGNADVSWGGSARVLPTYNQYEIDEGNIHNYNNTALLLCGRPR
jgi:hypothetical protein